MIKILKKNPGIFFTDNSSHEFDKYREFIQEQLLIREVNINNINIHTLDLLINNLDLSEIIIEKTKSTKFTDLYSIYLLVNFPDERFSKYKNYSIPFLICEFIQLFKKTYVYLPTLKIFSGKSNDKLFETIRNSNYSEFQYNESTEYVFQEINIYKIIKVIKNKFIEEFIKLCKKNKIQNISEIKSILKDKFQKIERS